MAGSEGSERPREVVALNPEDAEAITNRLGTAQTMVLGNLLWFLVRSDALMTSRRIRRIPVESFSLRIERAEDTDFGREVGRDEISWWINRKETNIPDFAERVHLALIAAQSLKEASQQLKKLEVRKYEEIVAAVQTFAIEHAAELVVVHGFAQWLYQRDQLAPSILFTYKVWGSTRRGDRMVTLTPLANSPQEEKPDVMQTLVETAWGFTSGGLSRYFRAHYEVGSDIYESMLVGGPVEEDAVHIPEGRVARRAAREITDECAVFFEFLRNSLRDIEGELEQRKIRETRLTSDRFWRTFISKARKSSKAEPSFWDFKESLSFWHAKARDDKRREKQKLAADIASFANAEGGCVIVGITDDRRVVGVSDSAREIENRHTATCDAIAEHFSYPRPITRILQIPVADDNGKEKICFVIAVARACEPAGAQDGEGAYVYPVRQGSGTTRADRNKLQSARIHDKNDRYTFLDQLEQLVADA